MEEKALDWAQGIGDETIGKGSIETVAGELHFMVS